MKYNVAMENRALDLVIRKTGLYLTESGLDDGGTRVLDSHTRDSLKAGSPGPSCLRRHATEGSDSRNRLAYMRNFGSVHSGEKKTVTASGTEDRNTKTLNITNTADKFLLGTMDVLSQDNDSTFAEDDMSRDRSLITQTSLEPIISPGENGFMPLPYSTHSSVYTAGPFSSASCTNETLFLASTLNGIPAEISAVTKKSSRCSRPPLLPPCRVCGDRASGYHYGVNTCEACKGFFRRSICKTESYVCNSKGDCKTVAGKRTACSHCRFKRCIEVGMSKSAIKTGRYTHELRSKNIMEVKRLQKQQSEESEGAGEDSSSDSRIGEVLYTEYKQDLFKRTLLEETVHLLTEGQKLLFEFLDDYYNDELIKERQIQVHNNFLEKRKRIVDRIKESTHGQVELTSFNASYPDNSTVSNSNCLTEDSNKRSLEETSDYVTNDVKRIKSETHNLEVSEDSKNSEQFKSVLHNESENKFTGTADRLKNIEDITAANSSRTLNSLESQEGVLSNSQNASNLTDGKESNKHMNEVVRTEVETVKAEVMTKIITDMEQGVQGMLAFAKCLPGFDELSKDDQAALLKAARFDIWYIGHIRCFNVELQVGACEWQFHAEELSQVWGNDLVDLAFTMSKAAKSLELTKQETAVLRAVCLTFTDRCMDLQQRGRVEEMHVFMLDVFKYVSSKRHNSYNKWFARVISFLVLLREFGVKFEKVSSQLKLDWSVLKDNPLLLSVFLS